MGSGLFVPPFDALADVRDVSRNGPW